MHFLRECVYVYVCEGEESIVFVSSSNQERRRDRKHKTLLNLLQSINQLKPIQDLGKETGKEFSLKEEKSDNKRENKKSEKKRDPEIESICRKRIFSWT